MELLTIAIAALVFNAFGATRPVRTFFDRLESVAKRAAVTEQIARDNAGRA